LHYKIKTLVLSFKETKQTMKSNFLLSILILLSFLQCETYESRKENLSKLSRNKILKYYEEGKLTFDKDIVYFNNEVALPADFVLVDSSDYCYDYFVDESGEIVLVEIRQATYHDDITEILIPLMDIDCDSLEAMAYEIARLTPKEIRNLMSFDSMQLDTLGYSDYSRIPIVSIDKHCRLSSLANKGEKSLIYFWDMVHHNENEVIAYYFSYFDELTKTGDIRPDFLALSTDRLLVRDGYKQAFGSQVDGPPIVRNKDSVDVRRARIGMEPLSVYLDRGWGIQWPAPKKLEP